MWIILTIIILIAAGWWFLYKPKEEIDDNPNSVTNVILEIDNMKNVKLNWALPTQRTSGFPLNVADIANVEVSLSADAGVNWAVLGTVLPGVPQEFLQTELEIGDWQFKLVVVDTASKRSADHIELVNVPDETAPNGVASVTVTIT